MKIKHVDGPSMLRCNGKQKPDQSKFCHGCPHVIIINTMYLCETLSNESGFVPFDLPICVLFNSKCPFIFLPLGLLTIPHVPASFKAFSSSWIAVCHFGQSGLRITSSRLCGSITSISEIAVAMACSN